MIVGLFHAAYNATTQSRYRENFLPVGDDIQLLLYLAVPILPAILIAILTRGRLGYASSSATTNERPSPQPE